MKRDIDIVCLRTREHFIDIMDGCAGRDTLEHLGKCVDCQREYKLYVFSVEQLRQLPGVDTPPYFEKRMTALVRERMEKSGKSVPVPRLAYLGATFALLLLLVNSFGPSDRVVRFAAMNGGRFTEELKHVSEYLLPGPEKIWNNMDKETETETDWLTGSSDVYNGANFGVTNYSEGGVRIIQTSYGF